MTFLVLLLGFIRIIRLYGQFSKFIFIFGGYINSDIYNSYWCCFLILGILLLKNILTFNIPGALISLLVIFVFCYAVLVFWDLPSEISNKYNNNKSIIESSDTTEDGRTITVDLEEYENLPVETE